MNELFFSKAVVEDGNRVDVWWVVKVGSGGVSGLVTSDSETFKYLCIWVLSLTKTQIIITLRVIDTLFSMVKKKCVLWCLVGQNKISL
jgi:hypothetical protein